jgi:hypothetical protein
VPADRGVDLDILVGDLLRALVGGGDTFGAGAIAHRRHHLVERPFQVDRGRPRREQQRVGALQRGVGGILAQRQRHAIGRRGADQRRAAHLHGLDRARRILAGRKPDRVVAMRQQRLVDRADRDAVGLDPDGARVLAVDFHGTSRALSSSTIPKSMSRTSIRDGHRFSEKIMLHQEPRA